MGIMNNNVISRDYGQLAPNQSVDFTKYYDASDLTNKNFSNKTSTTLSVIGISSDSEEGIAKHIVYFEASSCKYMGLLEVSSEEYEW